MRFPVFLLAGVLAGSSGAGARADSYSAIAPDFLVPDPSGRYYVVVQRKGGPTFAAETGGPYTLTIARRNPESPPMTHRRGEFRDEWPDRGYTIINRDEISVQPGDSVLGVLELRRSPYEVLISAEGRDIVALDSYFHNMGETKDSVVVIAPDGRIRFRYSLVDMFGDYQKQFFIVFYRVRWFRCGWIDEESHELVVVSHWRTGKPVRPRLVRVVSLRDGTMRPGGPDEITRAVSRAGATRDYAMIYEALNCCYWMKLRPSAEDLRSILDGERFPLLIRLQAALCLNAQGDRRGNGLFFSVVRGPASDARRPTQYPLVFQDPRAFAFEHLYEMTGAGVVPIVRPMIDIDADHLDYGVSKALEKAGSVSVPMLVEVLEGTKNLRMKSSIIRDLWSLGPKAEGAVPSLTRLLSSEASFEAGLLRIRIASEAADTLGRVGAGAAAALPALRRMAASRDAESAEAARRAIRAIEGRGED